MDLSVAPPSSSQQFNFFSFQRFVVVPNFFLQFYFEFHSPNSAYHPFFKLLVCSMAFLISHPPLYQPLFTCVYFFTLLDGQNAYIFLHLSSCPPFQNNVYSFVCLRSSDTFKHSSSQSLNGLFTLTCMMSSNCQQSSKGSTNLFLATYSRCSYSG